MASSQRGDFAYVTEVGSGALLARAEEQAVAAREADRGHSESTESGHQAFVHLAGKDHQRHVTGLRIGDAQSIDKLALFAQRLQHARQLHAAAVNHGHLIAVAHQFNDGAHATVQERWRLQARSSEFDDVPHSKPSAASFIRDLPIRANPASRSDSAPPGRTRPSTNYPGN